MEYAENAVAEHMPRLQEEFFKQNEVVDEAADLMYHLLVLLADQHLTLSDVSIRLKNRHLKQG